MERGRETEKEKGSKGTCQITTHHSMAAEFGICLQNAVCGGVVAGRVHGIRAGLIQGRGESHVPGRPTSDSDLGHVGLCMMGR